MEAIRKFAINDFQKQQFVEPPPDRYDILTIKKDTSACTAYSPASQHILHSLRQDMFVQKSLSSIQEIAHTASQDPPLLLIRVPFEPPMPVHKFYAASEDVLTLMRITQIDDCGLGLVSNDATGFHCLTPGNITAGGMGDMNDEEKGETPASYYIYCGAYKLVWSHNPRTKCTKAVAFMFKSGRGLDGFEDFVSSLLRDADLLVTHPLFIPLLAGTETVSFMEKTLRSQYDQCRVVERNSGVHPWRRVDVTEQGDTVRELAEMSRRMTALVVEVEMVLRRLRQWKLALHDFTNIIELYEKQGYRSTPEQHGLVANVISLTKSKLGSMEIDFVYVNVRAKNQVSAITQIMSRDDTLASIDLARSAARDGASMKVVAIMTMAFLPGTFFAALFAVPSLQWDNTNNVVGDNFWVYWAFTLPLTAIVFVLWIILTQREELAKLRLELFQLSVKKDAVVEKKRADSIAAKTSAVSISNFFSPASWGYFLRSAGFNPGQQANV